jgi:RimJ/RimL family protein N-acetyltransferase
MELTTARLRLRQWRDEDIEPFLEMSNDPDVMAHFPSLYTREAAEQVIAKQQVFIAEKGYGFWALEAQGAFVGFCGIKDVLFETPWTPAVEVGWRLARHAWGKGYAIEAARAAVTHGFTQLGLDEIVAFLLPMNQRSAAVCERLGMVRDPSRDFEHPLIPEGAISVGGFPQRHHIVYAVKR